MKRIFFLLAIFVSACASNSTAPVTKPAHPFPNAFKQVAVSFRSLPEHWDNSSSSYMYGQPNTSTNDTGTGPWLSDSWNFFFTSTSFSTSGDTLKAPGLRLVVDETSGILKFLNLYYSHDSNVYYEAPWSNSTSYGLSCHNITYTEDSLHQIVVSLSGQAVQTGLTNLGYAYSENLDYSSHGYSISNTNTYIGPVVDSSTLIIRFIP